MMSYTVSVAWSRPVSSPCYTEHGQRCGAVLSGRITINVKTSTTASPEVPELKVQERPPST
jgi:hypothetical protein